MKRRSNKPRELNGSALEGAELLESASYETGLSRAVLAERQQRLLARLEELPEVQADALRLRFFGGLKFSEIAQTMGSSLSAAKVRVRNGLVTLSERLRDEEGDSP